MMANQKMTAPLLTVLRDGAEDITIQTDNRDMLAWDMTRVKHKWPTMQDAPSIWLTFISWSACRRNGVIPNELRYEEWARQVIDVSKPDDEDEDSEVGAPFPEAPEPG